MGALVGGTEAAVVGSAGFASLGNCKLEVVEVVVVVVVWVVVALVAVSADEADEADEADVADVAAEAELESVVVLLLDTSFAILETGFSVLLVAAEAVAELLVAGAGLG